MAQLDDHSLLEQIAYQHWLDRGCPLGSSEVDWEFAERQLLSRGRPHQGEASLEHFEVGHVDQESTPRSITEARNTTEDALPGSEPLTPGVLIQSDVGLSGNSADAQPRSRQSSRTSRVQSTASRSRTRADGADRKAAPKPNS